MLRGKFEMCLDELHLPVAYFFLSTEEEATSGDYMWLVITASCVGAILILGAIIATVYYRRRTRGQLLLDDNAHGKETDNGHNFENPVYENID